tara:strand:- start:262 stop:474 length:213 start_codon:yes stop_codon:yes gene_type:complete
MRKSYIEQSSLEVNLAIDLGEINDLIKSLTDAAPEGSNNYRLNRMITKLKTVKREAVKDAVALFENMMDD